jgi:hypothetical protein
MSDAATLQADRREAGLRPWLTIALVSCAVLLYEIAITRILSVVLWYHFAFLSLSLAMLGLGAPGVWFSLRAPRTGSLRTALLVSAATIPLSVVFIVKSRPLLEAVGLAGDAWIAGIVVFILTPMCSLGSAVCILLLRARGRRIGGMYGADLVGAMAGALLAVPLMTLLPTPQIVGLAGLLPLLGCLLLHPASVRWAIGIGFLLLAAVVWGEPFAVEYNKSYSESRFSPVWERWTPTARITVFDRPIWSPDADVPWLWGLGSRYRPRPVPQMWIDQDGSAGTPIEHPTGEPAALEHLMFDVTSVGYQLVSPDRVCIIGAGGGRDILTALESGADEVDAVELNGAIVSAISGPFGDFSGDVYHLPGVRPVIDEGRSFLLRTETSYDLIQISLVDSWAATAAGAYALSENFLYTVEAIQLYWRRLSDTGLVSISRWTGGAQQLESARLARLATEALTRLGVAEARRHLALVEAAGVGTLLVSRRPFVGQLLSDIDTIVARRGFSRRWPPSAPSPDDHVARVLTEGTESYRRAGLDLSPPTDDRPFFFQTVLPLAKVDPTVMERLGPNEKSVTVLRWLLVMLVVLTLVLFFSPFALAGRIARHRGFWRGSGYFAAIGSGFMLVEIPWIQRSILFLGHPSYATAAVLAFLLLGAGTGSMAAGRVDLAVLMRWRWTVPVVVVGAYGLATPAFQAALGLPLPARVVLAGAFLLPTGFFMGFPFPVGMLRFGDANKAWYWAVNGAFGVLASASSLILAMAAGFSRVLAFGVLAYGGAVLLTGSRQRAGRDVTPSTDTG